jgi:hypothetical protein
MNKLLILLIFLASFCAAQESPSPDDKKEQQRLGLTQEEWRTYKQSGMSKRMLKRILSSGITLDEYFKHPWQRFGMPEEKWLELRRKGFSDEDIGISKERTEYEHGLALKSIILPGFGHFKKGQLLKGGLFSGTAVGSIGLTVATKQPVFLSILVLDCMVSGFDIWRQTRYESNPDLKRFSVNLNPQDPGITCTMRF